MDMTPVGCYRVRFADGTTTEIPLRFGQEIYNYRFTLGGKGEPDPLESVMARFSMVFRRDENSGSWRIIDHHSSQFPDGEVEGSS